MNNSNLLINEPPLQVLPSLAVAVGLNEAIMLQQVHYWINNPKLKAKEYDGKRWVYNSISQWQSDNFPFWSTNTIRRTVESLEKQGILLTEKLSPNSLNRVKYYTIDYDALELAKCIRPLWANGIVQNGQMLTETTAQNTATAGDSIVAPYGAVGDETSDQEQEGESMVELPILTPPPFPPANPLMLYPAAVRPVVECVARLLKVEPGRTRGKGGKWGPSAYWIKRSMELNDSCGDLVVQALEMVWRDVKGTEAGKNFTDPGSFCKMAPVAAGKLRERVDRDDYMDLVGGSMLTQNGFQGA